MDKVKAKEWFERPPYWTTKLRRWKAHQTTHKTELEYLSGKIDLKGGVKD